MTLIVGKNTQLLAEILSELGYLIANTYTKHEIGEELSGPVHKATIVAEATQEEVDNWNKAFIRRGIDERLPYPYWYKILID